MRTPISFTLLPLPRLPPAALCPGHFSWKRCGTSRLLQNLFRCCKRVMEMNRKKPVQWEYMFAFRRWQGKRGYGSGSHNRSRGVAPATKEAGGRLRHEDGDGGRGLSRAKRAGKTIRVIIFLLFLEDEKAFGERFFSFGT